MINTLLILLKSEIEPMWQTLIMVGLFVIAFFVWILPRELRKREEQDEKYASRKGITVEQLRQIRITKRARHIPNSVRNDVLARDGYQCVYCGASDNLAIDHIFPFSRGGSNTSDNLQVLCRSCNSTKGASVADD
jgi:5-methylcytosine-specific restriction endonuclease McrA